MTASGTAAANRRRRVARRGDQPAAVRAQRVDAQRNRSLLLRAAAQAFAEYGVDVPVEQIARRAGVAKGTLFRHFPTKERLLAAVLSERLAQVRELVSTLAEQRDVGLATIGELMASAAAVLAADRSFFDAATCATVVDPDVRRAKAALEHDLNALLARAQASGEVRSDIVGSDIGMLVMAATNTCAPSAQHCPELWRRYLALMLDGLRPGATTPLPVAPLAATALATPPRSGR
jgi:AcrR family transcriptional regulator